MSNPREAAVRLVVFCPHNDAAAPIQDYQSLLFTSGMKGALSFPVCAVLGKAVEPLSKGELKGLASRLREIRSDDPFVVGPPSLVEAPAEPAGTLGIPLYESAMIPRIAIDRMPGRLEPFDSPGILIAAASRREQLESAASPFPLRFRAGYVANLLIRRTSVGAAGLSYEWDRGLPVWMPK